MAASCYLCNRGYPTIPGILPGEAIGVCENCSIMACEAHAQRDPNYPRWICVLCDTSLLTAAGISASGGASLSTTLTVLVSNAMLKDGSRYERLEQFLEERPNYSWVSAQLNETLEKAPSQFTTNATKPFWFGLSQEGKRFIAAAIIIVESLNLSEDELVEALRILMHAWRSR